ncbi:MAG: recombinase family protein [Oscillospiraceae bacterium]|jgi:DNA invertase Pin-like site-specific DNA recombinase|nr:recombinase family protein [Oscillospiraceae bacterium]
MIFAYCRVSTNKGTQKTDRQVLAIKEYAKRNNFTVNEFVEETMSGKDLNRPKYNAMRDKMRKGDILIISDIDRLGRNADQVIVEFKHFKSLGIKVVALDTPYLNQWDTIKEDSMYDMVTDILITLKAHLAQQEREKLISRINQGLDVARAKGKKLGRPKKAIDDKVVRVYHRVQQHELTKVEASKILGISRQHFDRLIHRLKG